MNHHKQPLSPHLGVYKPQLTSVLSILHRLTGLTLVFILFGLSLWLYSLSMDSALFMNIMSHLQTAYGKVLTGGMFFVFFYHLYNGLRHLMWDFGKGFLMTTVYRTGYFVLTITSLSTILILMCLWLI